ncbi:MAG: chromate resistance protein ChrB [Oscillospiraceae bacterium]|nr:chromate resistance protein ChrB [Oscillospiraceae bacterium]
MNTPIKWLALGYNLPINPSKNRVYVWRKLKDIGAAYLNHGMALLPKASKKTAELAGLAKRIREMGGEATLIEMSFVDQRDELEMIARFREQSAREYQTILEHCAGLWTGKEDLPQMSESFKKVVRQYSKAKARDHFDSAAAGDLEKNIDQIFDRLMVTELGSQLKKFMDKAGL